MYVYYESFMYKSNTSTMLSKSIYVHEVHVMKMVMNVYLTNFAGCMAVKMSRPMQGEDLIKYMSDS